VSVAKRQSYAEEKEEQDDDASEDSPPRLQKTKKHKEDNNEYVMSLDEKDKSEGELKGIIKEDCNQEITGYKNLEFENRFFVNEPSFANLSELDALFEEYEKAPNARLNQISSICEFIIVDHILVVHFMQRLDYGTEIMPSFSKGYCFDHCGTPCPDVASDGRKWK
jgi:hypothetical protein